MTWLTHFNTSSWYFTWDINVPIQKALLVITYLAVSRLDRCPWWLEMGHQLLTSRVSRRTIPPIVQWPDKCRSRCLRDTTPCSHDNMTVFNWFSYTMSRSIDPLIWLGINWTSSSCLIISETWSRESCLITNYFFFPKLIWIILE